MSDPVIWKIVDGQLGLAVVDRGAVGYDDTWRAPGGAQVDDVTLGDYLEASATFMCQVTQARITSTPSTTTEDIEATMCAPAKTVPTPGESSFAFELGALSDANRVAGLSRYAFEWDASEVYLYVGFDAENPPKAIGRVMMAALPIGGAMRAKLLETVTWPFVSKPQIAFGNAAESIVLPPEGGVVATGATAGTPGSFTPPGATAPADAAGLVGLTASPATAWLTGQYVQTATAGTTGRGYWDGAAWVPGAAAP